MSSTPKTNTNTIRVRIDLYDYLPIPNRFLKQLQWEDGDLIEIERIEDTLILTKVEPEENQ
jgi:bifunctional DNA-binding transcriptional regulator/antitoxin component of YhaV-PrlF toxin-antitoxin module